MFTDLFTPTWGVHRALPCGKHWLILQPAWVRGRTTARCHGHAARNARSGVFAAQPGPQGWGHNSVFLGLPPSSLHIIVGACPITDVFLSLICSETLHSTQKPLNTDQRWSSNQRTLPRLAPTHQRRHTPGALSTPGACRQPGQPHCLGICNVIIMHFPVIIR